MRTSSVLIILAAMTWSAHAQLIGDTRCKDSAYVSKMLHVIVQNLQQISEAIETVPPSEADYIREEKRLAIEQQNETRFSLVMSNRFYYPFAFHDDYTVVKDNLGAATRAHGKDQVRFLIVVLSRIGDLQSSMGDYINFDSSRPKSVLNKEKRQDMYFSMPVAKGRLTSLLQCIISQL